MNRPQADKSSFLNKIQNNKSPMNAYYRNNMKTFIKKNL